VRGERLEDVGEREFMHLAGAEDGERRAVVADVEAAFADLAEGDQGQGVEGGSGALAGRGRWEGDVGEAVDVLDGAEQ
jgi:hypothetical protein